MDWYRDGSGLLPGDLKRVFKYAPRYATVLRIVEGDKEPFIQTLKTEEEWTEWIEKERPSPNRSRRGLVLLLMERGGMGSLGLLKMADSDEELKPSPNDITGRPEALEVPEELAKRGENGACTAEIAKAPVGGCRGLRTVPFEQETFDTVSRAFNMHSSISRAISRADVPVFSHVGAFMKDGADQSESKHGVSVYNCRTSNAWKMDLALTVTYFPKCELSFAVLFGCQISTVLEILRRLRHAHDDVLHPLLLPGIVAELERQRHFDYVDNIVDELEARIFDLEIRPDALDGIDVEEIVQMHKDKRSAWLNMTYTRNCLKSWKVQLENMLHQTEALDPSIKNNDTSFNGSESPHTRSEATTPTYTNTSLHEPESPHDYYEADVLVHKNLSFYEPGLLRTCSEADTPTHNESFHELEPESPYTCSEADIPAHNNFPFYGSGLLQTSSEAVTPLQKSASLYERETLRIHSEADARTHQTGKLPEQDPGDLVEPSSSSTTLVSSSDVHYDYHEKRKATGYKIASRIRALIDEYDDKIRDCTMRIDGMAMATQWAQGEINLEIAKATSRDSKHMRSIALVTMVFLPGTFFAGMFSMTFFNWSNDNGEPIVSEYFWVYVVFTIVCTLLTVGLWYYFNISRRSRRRPKDLEHSETRETT